MAVCTPRQYAENNEIVVALIHGEDATVKRFFLHRDHVELRPENPDFPVMRYRFDEVLVQGRVIGIQSGIALRVIAMTARKNLSRDSVLDRQYSGFTC